MVRRTPPAAVAVLVCAAAAACRSPATVPPPSPPGEPAPVAAAPAPRLTGDAIVVAGRRVSIGTPVVLWSDEGGYDAYATRPAFRSDAPAGEGLRYRPGRERVSSDPAHRPTTAELADAVDLFVVHYDVCGTSRRCFRVLHDERKLSVHFLIDVDGTVYQTLDVAETAWHASGANARSIGVELAQIGAYPPGASSPLSTWYRRDLEGTRLVLPDGGRDSGVRTAGFEGRPRRPDLVRGRVQGQELEQYDFTSEQYDALAHLVAGLSSLLPGIELTVPRDARGGVRAEVLSEEQLAGYRGVVGHYHTGGHKVDPGPAFDWERFLVRARTLRGRPPTP